MTKRPPSELGEAGKALWDAVTGPIEFEDPREVHALRQACRLEDDVVRLRAELALAALVVAGSTGQPVESPLLGSTRQAVALQARLLGSIAVDTGAAQRSHAGRVLAAQRWSA